MSAIVLLIRRAVLRSGQTRYRISKGSGVSQAQLTRLVNRDRRMLRVDTIERLAEYLGLRITIEPKVKTRKG